jgi:CheY-like chemotaxis protein
MAQLDKAFTGLRILVVEDNFLAAEVVRDTLESNGCTVVGPVGRIADGLRLAEQEALDGAVLDVNLNGDWCFPIAETLRRRDVPFIFLTGYDDAAIIPVELRRARRLSKPVLGPHLIEALSEVI